MVKQKPSRTSDDHFGLSRISDTHTLGEVLRSARLNRELTQTELAGKLGRRQRQISDLERVTTDPRLSTIQNVARALELELMLIPRHLIAAVEALQRAGSDAGRRPLYALDDEDTQGAADQPSQPEVGDSGAPADRPEHPRPRRRPER